MYDILGCSKGLSIRYQIKSGLLWVKTSLFSREVFYALFHLISLLPDFKPEGDRKKGDCPIKSGNDGMGPEYECWLCVLFLDKIFGTI